MDRPIFRPIVDLAAAADPVPISRLTGEGSVLVLAPHPDDESLGCGGAIAAAAEAGHRVNVVVVTDGSQSHPGSRAYPRAALANLRRAEVAQAVSILTAGVSTPIMLNYPDQGAPNDANAHAAIASHLAPILEEVTAIWACWEGDPHPDHQRSWTIACALSAQIPQSRLLAFAVWGRVQGDASPDTGATILRFETRRWRHLKARAIAAHRSQMTGLIDDDPDGFMMPPALARHFLETDEIFLDLTP